MKTNNFNKKDYAIPLPDPYKAQAVFRHKPSLPYSGLTIVLSNPSRFDRSNLLNTDSVKNMIERGCLQPYATLRSCDIRTANTRQQGLLPGTKGIILLGEFAMRCWAGNKYGAYSLHEQRGYLLEDHPWREQGIHVIPSYFPQDCIDPEDYESRFNKMRKDYLEEARAGADIEGTGKSRKSKTMRANYRFWLQRDFHKILALIRGKRDPHKPNLNTSYIIYPPNADDAITYLSGAADQDLYFDIETDSDWNITCFSVAVGTGLVMCIPLLRYTYNTAYQIEDQAKIFRALIKALHTCKQVIIHNAQFDLFILAHKYRMPIGRRVFDTMWAHWRCFPRVEKSLGHAISNFCLEEHYHKDEGVFEPQNSAQEEALWRYNARDVTSMRLVHLNMMDYVRKQPGLAESIQQSNDMIYPYLLNTLMGIRYDPDALKEASDLYDREMTQYLRVIKILIGEEVLPTSPKQCLEYFRYGLNYKVVGRTETGNAQYNEQAFYKLKIDYPNNPVIDFMLKYRHAAKERGMLKFEPWIQ